MNDDLEEIAEQQNPYPNERGPRGSNRGSKPGGFKRSISSRANKGNRKQITLPKIIFKDQEPNV